jgi:hypothetical protein
MCTYVSAFTLQLRKIEEMFSIIVKMMSNSIANLKEMGTTPKIK